MDVWRKRRYYTFCIQLFLLPRLPTPPLSLSTFQAKKLSLLPDFPLFVRLVHGPDMMASRLLLPFQTIFFFLLTPSINLFHNFIMQFLRNGQKNAFMAVRCMSTSTTKPKKLPKTPRYTPQNQQILDEMMIPGPALRFFKTKKERKRPEILDIVREKK